jgi:hypothetical protein
MLNSSPMQPGGVTDSGICTPHNRTLGTTTDVPAPGRRIGGISPSAVIDPECGYRLQRRDNATIGIPVQCVRYGLLSQSSGQSTSSNVPNTGSGSRYFRSGAIGARGRTITGAILLGLPVTAETYVDVISSGANWSSDATVGRTGGFPYATPTRSVPQSGPVLKVAK